MSIADKILLRKLALIETVNDELKNIAQIEHSRHCSFNNVIANSLSAIAAYCFFEKKPAIDLCFAKDGQLTMFWIILNSRWSDLLSKYYSSCWKFNPKKFLSLHSEIVPKAKVDVKRCKAVKTLFKGLTSLKRCILLKDSAIRADFQFLVAPFEEKQIAVNS